MLAAVHRAGRLTAGRFDASVLADLERLGEHGATLGPSAGPADARRDAASAAIGPAGTPRASLVRAPAGSLDAGGIGKGLALRWASAAAIGRRSRPGRASSSRPAATSRAPGRHRRVAGGSGSRIRFSQVRSADPLAVLAVERGSVATSSVRVRNWIAPDGRRVHHLVDPANRGAGEDRADRGHGGGPRSGVVRGLEQVAVPRGPGPDRTGGAGARPRGLVGGRGGTPGDDPGGPPVLRVGGRGARGLSRPEVTPARAGWRPARVARAVIDADRQPGGGRVRRSVVAPRAGPAARAWSPPRGPR